MIAQPVLESSDCRRVIDCTLMQRKAGRITKLRSCRYVSKFIVLGLVADYDVAPFRTLRVGQWLG
jgi:hypothetical protein